MKFLILLIALGVERYLNISQILCRFNWFDGYLNFESKYLRRKNLWHGFLGLAFVVLPLVIMVALVYYTLGYLLFGFVGFILALLIFLYCLGPQNFYTQLERYFTFAHQEANIQAEQTVQNLITPEFNAAIPLTRRLSRGMFVNFNQRIFAVSFWFLILGPVGAVFYRSVVLLQHAAAQPAESNERSMLSAARWILAILDWIPARLSGLGYALMGHFMKGFSYWMKHCFSGFDKNEESSVGSGFAALEIDAFHDSDLEENKAVLGLIDRTLIMYLVLVAVFTLGTLVY